MRTRSSRARSRRNSPPPSTDSPPSSPSVLSPSPSVLSPPRADVILSNLAILSFILSVGVLFFNTALAVAILLTGVLRPAWQTYKSLQSLHDAPVLEEYISSDGEEAIRIQTVPQTNRNWQAYWVIFSLLFTLDALSHPVLGALLPRPFYLSLVFSTVAWLGRAGATNAAIMFRTTVVPAFTAIEGGVEKCTHLVMTRLDRATGEAIVGFNCLIAPYARHLEAVATATNRQLQERERRTWRRRRTDILRM